MAVTVTSGVSLTPFNSAGFPDSSFSAMVAFGLSFGGDKSTLCSTAFRLPFGRQLKERSGALQLGDSYRFHVADREPQVQEVWDSVHSRYLILPWAEC